MDKRKIKPGMIIEEKNRIDMYYYRFLVISVDKKDESIITLDYLFTPTRISLFDLKNYEVMGFIDLNKYGGKS